MLRVWNASTNIQLFKVLYMHRYISISINNNNNNRIQGCLLAITKGSKRCIHEYFWGYTGSPISMWMFLQQ